MVVCSSLTQPITPHRAGWPISFISPRVEEPPTPMVNFNRTNLLELVRYVIVSILEVYLNIRPTCWQVFFPHYLSPGGFWSRPSLHISKCNSETVNVSSTLARSTKEQIPDFVAEGSKRIPARICNIKCVLERLAYCKMEVLKNNTWVWWESETTRCFWFMS